MIWAARHRVLVLLLTIYVGEAAGSMQQGAALRVHVVDPARAHITEATVRLKAGDGSLIKEIKSTRTQPVAFTMLAPGRYVLEVVAEGFKPYAGEIQIRRGANDVTVELKIAGIKENVDVKRDELERAIDPREGAFTNFLSREQIAALPDDPEEMQRVLRQIAGQDAVIRVDGFTGGRLPPKSQIASIKIVRSNFDAEFHEAGSPLVDVTTRAGGSSWNGSIAFRFNDEALNARQPFAAPRN